MGRVVGENEQPLSNVIGGYIWGRLERRYNLRFRHLSPGRVPADKAFAIVFSYTGYKTEQRNFLLNENEEENVVVRLERGTVNWNPW